MRGEENRVPLLAVLAHFFLEDVRRARVKPHHRLIQHPDWRLMHQSADNRQLLLHAARVGLNLLTRRVFQLKQRQILLDMRLALLRANAVNIRHKVQVLHPRQAVIQFVAVRNETNHPLSGNRIILHRHAADGHAAARGLQNTRQQTNRGRFACPIRPDKAEQLPLANVQRQVIHCANIALAVLLHHMIKINHFLKPPCLISLLYRRTFHNARHFV